MEFSDQSHINLVRDALWQRSSRASVMVGAGFSKNAERIISDVPEPPSWGEVARAMFERLYPDSGNENEESSKTARWEAIGALRVAQEFEAAFGPTELRRFLGELIRDDELQPGRAHEQLLRLPWRDVFTTNWDTLLERASSSIAERSYNVLCSTEDIPLASRPRIVKLHGSLDAQFPPIVTEEQYRTYPAKFAPFVNTVQQAMMETVFFLIGFSGDDPNFLHWSGWVRDNLGKLAPKIYLAGWLELSVHRRRMLEHRNVVAIDLSSHPKAGKWRRCTENVLHHRATDWLLRTLMYGRPYEISNWPSPRSEIKEEVPGYLLPVERKQFNVPKEEPEQTWTHGETAEKLVDSVRNLVSVWRFNREKTYPGWLTVPYVARTKMSSTREWAPYIADALLEMNPVEQLYVLRELIWRWEKQLEPMSTVEPVWLSLEKAARGALERIDCEAEEIDGKTDTAVDWLGIGEAWVVAALALLSATRFRFDCDEFERLVSILKPIAKQYEEITHHIAHEQCIRAVYALDYEALQKLLEHWKTGNADPVWMMRKAAFLFEVGQEKKGAELNARALGVIRSNHSNDLSVARLSREAWALFCAGATLGNEEYWQASIERQRRWDELTKVKCNAGLEMHHYTRAIEGERDKKKGQPFDLGMVWKEGISFSNAVFLKWAACHRGLRVADVAGLPPSARRVETASPLLRLAATGLAPHEPELAARVAMRAARRETTGTLNSVLSRAHLAAIPQEAARRLAQHCIGGVEFIVSGNAVADSRTFWNERLQVHLESLSRFVIRLSPNEVDAIFTKVLAWYEEEISSIGFGMADPVRMVLSRCWESMPEEGRAARFLDVLNAPIIGMDGFAAGTDGMLMKMYPDASDALTKGLIPSIEEDAVSESQWNETIEFIVRGLRGEEQTRIRAARRLSWLVDVKPLSDEGASKAALALWGKDWENSEGLPSGTDLHDWGFLVMPEPVPGIGEQRFRDKWLSASSWNKSTEKKASAILWQIGFAIDKLKVHGKQLVISDKEQTYLENVVGMWVKESIPVPLNVSQESAPIFANNADEDTRQAILGLQHILLVVNLCDEIGEALYKKFEKLNESTMPARGLTAGLIKALPERVEDMVQSMRAGLASDEKVVAINAVSALEFWIQAAKEGSVGLPGAPTELIQEIGVTIVTRRKAALAQALRAGKWIVLEGSPSEKKIVGNLAAQGLGYLLQELKYDSEHDEELDVPLLRWCCVQLAVAMAGNGWAGERNVVNWIKKIRDDPLPEIRHTRVTHKSAAVDTAERT